MFTWIDILLKTVKFQTYVCRTFGKIVSTVTERFAVIGRVYTDVQSMPMFQTLVGIPIQARSQVLKFGGAKYIFRGARFLFLLYF